MISPDTNSFAETEPATGSACGAATGARAPTFSRRLANGLTVLVRGNREVAVATADVWVATGSAGETPEISGISHFLEHMLFKGTENFGLGQIEREIENIGGACNAGTSYDFTHYYITLPSAGLDRGVQMLAEMVRSWTLDASELEKERGVILEEYRRKQDNPGAMLYEDAYERLFAAGPYHHSVIGAESTIRSITRDQMLDYYHRHYAPSNMTLVLTGDVSDEDAIALAERHFGDYERPYNPILAGPEPTRYGVAESFHREKPTGGEVYWALARSASEPADSDGPEGADFIVALDLAQFILGQGRASRLYREIKQKRSLASTVSCHYSTMRHGAGFMIDATCERAKQAELREAVEAEVARLGEEPIPPADLNRARRLLTSAHLFSFETCGSASSQTGYYHMLTGGIDFLDSYLDRLAAATPESVRAAVTAVLADGDWVEISVGPEASGEGDDSSASTDSATNGAN